MTLYARNDIQLHYDPENGHRHSRPTKGDGTPVPVWGISCPDCERKLSTHPAWSPSRYKIPLTPDEQQAAEDERDAAQRAMQQQQMLLAQAAFNAQMAAKGAVPEDNPDDIAISTDPEPETPADLATKAVLSQASDYEVLTKTDLKDLARDRGLPVSGTHAELVTRLAEFDNSN